MPAFKANREPQLLEEGRLKQISRAIRELVPRSPAEADDAEKLQLFWNTFDDVLFTSESHVLGVAHRVAAWNTLCSLVDQSLQSDVGEVKSIIWEQNIWSRAFVLYLEHARNARPKSSRQLLVTLTSAVQKSNHSQKDDVIALAADTLIASLVDYGDAPKAKAAMQLLTHLLSKQVFQVKQFSSAFTILRPGVRVVEGTLNAADLLYVLLSWLGRGDFGSTIAASIGVVLDRIDQYMPDHATARSPLDAKIWQTPLESIYIQGHVNIDDLRAHIFPMLFTRNKMDFQSFLAVHGIEVGRETSAAALASGPYAGLLHAVLQAGKALGLLIETDGKKVVLSEGVIGLPISFINSLLFDNDRSARLTGLFLLLTSPATSKPFSASALSTIKKALGVYFSDVDADFRSELFGSFQRLMDRLRSVTCVLERSKSQHTMIASSAEHLQMTMRDYRDFLKWLLRFLSQELRSTASYQRHICALRCLSIFSRSGIDPEVPFDRCSKSAQGQIKWALRMQIMNDKLRRLLVDLLMNPFEDVRKSAFSTLELYCVVESAAKVVDDARDHASLSAPSQDLENVYLSTLNRAEDMMYLTGRADHADGVAYLYSLWYRACVRGARSGDPWKHAEDTVVQDRLLRKLNEFVNVAHRSLSEAVAHYPLHSLLTSLRYVLMQRASHIQHRVDDGVFDAVFGLLEQIWHTVRPILCDDAPEGYLPEELESASNDTKETLSYCWRALKEGSLLLGVLISSVQPTTEDPDDNRIDAWTRLCFTQLSELRHRGAFSTVAQTWSTCCNRAKTSNSQGQRKLDVWYSDVLRMLEMNVTINTRRSAGLPSLMCGILAADDTGQLVPRAVADLETIARREVDAASAEEGSLAQVHAMNCFKDILKNSRLGEQSEPFLTNALQLSADALTTNAWAIRNCGLMLFRAVIDRLLGTSDAHLDEGAPPHKRISTEAYPQLLDVVLSLLKAPTNGTTARFEGVFPALQLLRLTKIPADRLVETCAAVESLTASSSWHVRDKAASTLAHLTTLGNVALRLDELLCQSRTRENGVHGLLLVASFTVSRIASSNLQPGAAAIDASVTLYDCSCLARSIGEIYYAAESPLVKAASLDVIRACSSLLVSITTTTGEKHDHLPLIMALQPVDSGATIPIDVLGTVLSTLLHDPALAVIRQAWSRLVAQYLMAELSAPQDHLVIYYSMVKQLLQHDSDAVIQFLHALNPAKICHSSPMSDFTIKVCAHVLDSATDTDVKCAAQKTAIELADASQNILDLKALAKSFTVADSRSNQQYADQALQLNTLLMDKVARRDEAGESILLQDISIWADECIAAVDGTGIYTREAAVEAFSRVSTLWREISVQPTLNRHHLRLCMAVYDLLNDDDEDIRLAASNIATRITAIGPRCATGFEPIVASQRLLAFCLGRWPDHPDFAAHAFQRAFGINITSTVPRSVEVQLSASMQGDTALFAEEKQNLYIDEAREVRAWSQVLHKTSVPSIDKSLVSQLGQWVEQGLQSLAFHADQNADGALGWSSQPEIYILGLQVFYACELMFNLTARGMKVPIQPSELRKQLYTCITNLEKAEVNCLWLWEAERILSESLSLKISSVSTFIGKGLEEHI